MKNRSEKKIMVKAACMALALLMGGTAATAQSYYDDDIYYDASKAKKEQKQTKNGKTTSAKQPTNVASSQYYYDGAEYVPWDNVGDFQAAGSYKPEGTSTRDVDEYNRRYPSTNASGMETTDSITLEQFTAMSNTRNLARFHNSEIAANAYTDNGVDDPDYYVNADGGSYGAPDSYYYGTPSTPTVVNVNLTGGYYNDPWYWGSPWYGGWYGGYYRPYYYSYYGPGWYGPSWSWSWGGPSWSWGWGGPGWGWGGPVHHPAGPGWGGHYRPTYTSSGAYSPNGARPGATNGVRPSGSGISRPSTGATARPSGSGVTTTRPSTTSRPGYRSPIGQPPQNATVNRGNDNRGTLNTGRNSSTSRQPSTTNSNNNSYNSNRNSGSFSSGRSSGSFSSGGSRSSGGFSSGGGSRSSGGGHRGR